MNRKKERFDDIVLDPLFKKFKKRKIINTDFGEPDSRSLLVQGIVTKPLHYNLEGECVFIFDENIDIRMAFLKHSEFKEYNTLLLIDEEFFNELREKYNLEYEPAKDILSEKFQTFFHLSPERTIPTLIRGIISPECYDFMLEKTKEAARKGDF